MPRPLQISSYMMDRKFLGKGYKVGRVDQAETALGAEMRLANEKGKPKPKQTKEKEKIVRRLVHHRHTSPSIQLTCRPASFTKFTPMAPLLTVKC